MITISITDKEAVEKAAPGFKKQQEREQQRRDQMFADPKSQLNKTIQKIDQNQPVWVNIKGADVLQIPGSKWCALPINGKKTAATFQIIDLKKGVEGPQLKKAEVNAWLVKADGVV